MRFNKILSLTLIVIIIIGSLSFTPLALYADSPSVEISGESAIVIDLEKGQVLFEKYADKQFPALIISRLMTTLLAIENISANSSVTISQNAAKAKGNNVTLKSGQICRLEDLLAASVLTLSDNACTALFEAVNPDPIKYVELMNSKAASLSMNNTLFSSPLGTNDNVCYSTAKDLSVFMTHAYNTQTFKDIFCSIHWFPSEINDLSLNETRLLKNNNAVVFNYSYAKGGCQMDLGNGMVSSVTYAGRNDMNLLAIVLNTPEDKVISDNVSLFDYCFYGFEKISLVTKGGDIGEITVASDTIEIIAANDVSYITAKGKNYIITTEIMPMENLEPPIEAGTLVGTVKYTLIDGSTILVSALAKNSVYSESATINDIMKIIVANKDILNLVLALTGILIILGILHITRFISGKISTR